MDSDDYVKYTWVMACGNYIKYTSTCNQQWYAAATDKHFAVITTRLFYSFISHKNSHGVIWIWSQQAQ